MDCCQSPPPPPRVQAAAHEPVPPMSPSCRPGGYCPLPGSLLGGRGVHGGGMCCAPRVPHGPKGEGETTCAGHCRGTCSLVVTRRQTCKASWAQGRGWGWGAVCRGEGTDTRHRGGGGGGSKSRPPCFLVPNGGPAHGLHPPFVVAEIWAD